MPYLPSGTVTFLFTDIEGSTRLLHELGADGYAEALAEHRRVLREAFSRHGGVEVDTQGDAFFVAFPTAPGALAAAGAAQRDLGLPVRMGVHTGTPLLTDEGYVGTDVHRAARIAAAGHGRQVLVSAASAALLDAGELRDLGEHRLKDLSAPERIFQLGDGDFPPLKTLYRTNLPIPATPFLGREHELREVRELLTRDDARLLTLTGAGGSGKTRLALQAAGELTEAYPDGVWWVPLAPLTDPADVGAAAARALGDGGSLPEIVNGRRLLLLLDNFEHVVEAAPDVAAVLAECPHADVLVTSRERLRVQGEHVYSVPVLERAQARGLFFARARAAQPNYEPDEHLDELCERLDDLPLALELAAARTSLLSTEQLLERLGDRLDLLRGGRDAETRQRTLRATIEWSYELLDPEEQALLAALSVFRGGWTLEAAEQVVGADLELMQSLVDKSLVRRWESGRFGMLETIREFAAEQLDQSSARDELRERLLEHLIVRLAEANLSPHSTGTPRIDLAREERPNVDVALAWATEAGSATAGLRLLEVLEIYWTTNDPIVGRERLDALLALDGDALEPDVLATAHRFRGATFDMTGRHDLSEPEYLRARELAVSAGNATEAAHLTQRIAMAIVQQGDLERASGLLMEALASSRERGNLKDEAIALSGLAQVALGRGHLDEGARLSNESAQIAESIGWIWWRGVTLGTLADFLVERDPREAEEVLLSALLSLDAAGDRGNVTLSLSSAAMIAARRGNAERAGTLWGAVEAEAERQPRPSTNDAMAEVEPSLETVRGDAFEEARRHGSTLNLEDAVTYALGERA
jgi:predicted ATPase